ncbi:MAG: phosphatase PAP2 family protein [Alphaproteobacteria bacterium]|nr:phosphatase PAP2 family protein [Alphaproteobacteria bacterium]MDE2335816.1 phosphatase PAP2 family protein [Alphaproteobacteria bacterium]
MWKRLKDWKETRIGTVTWSPNTRAIWTVIALLALVNAVGLEVQGLSLVLRALFANVAAVAIILCISFVYTYIRPRPRIAEMTHMTAIILAFTCGAAIFSYIVATVHRPLVDAALVAGDRALGLDWLAGYKWVMAHPYTHAALLLAYATLIPQLLLVVFTLNFHGLCARGWEAIWLLVVSCVGCVVASGVWPAEGAFGYYHVDFDRAYVQVFLGLHDGAIKTIGNQPIQGIIQFPSFHVALAILLTYAARGRPWLFTLLLEINILLFLSTPAIGGHHFADVWGGVVLALLSIWFVRAAVAPRLMPDMAKITES